MAEQTKNIETPQEREKRKKNRLLSDIRKVGETAEGRRFIWYMMTAGEPFKDPFCGELTLHTHVRLGEQRISRNLLFDVLSASPKLYSQIQQEYDSEKHVEEQLQEEEIKIRRDNPI